jgi:hypothetical protein
LECDECGEFDDGVLVKMTLQSLDEAIKRVGAKKIGASLQQRDRVEVNTEAAAI